MTVSGLPGPGATARSAPTAGIHHSAGWSGSSNVESGWSAETVGDEAVANRGREGPATPSGSEPASTGKGGGDLDAAGAAEGRPGAGARDDESRAR